MLYSCTLMAAARSGRQRVDRRRRNVLTSLLNSLLTYRDVMRVRLVAQLEYIGRQCDEWWQGHLKQLEQSIRSHQLAEHRDEVTS